MGITDKLDRPLRSLRISVTDRCNLRCRYCMPEEDYIWVPHEQILRFEEILSLVRVFAAMGVRKVRLTGGEPLLRRDLASLVHMLACDEGVQDLAMTTNGVLLAEHARELAEAGLRRLTVSLDTLSGRKLQTLTGQDVLRRVQDGIDAARHAGLEGLKLNAVIIRGLNNDELVDLIEFGRKVEAEVRFIEYMDVGGATRWSRDQVMSAEQMLSVISRHYGEVQPLAARDRAPAEQYRLPDGTVFGIISSTTIPFCRWCDRSRLTCDGMWYTCLYAERGLDLRAALREGANSDELTTLIRHAWEQRSDRGAEVRLVLPDRGPFVPVGILRSDHHLEMHTRGG